MINLNLEAVAWFLVLILLAWAMLAIFDYEADRAHRERSERLKREQEDFRENDLEL